MILFDLWVNRSLSKNECFELIETSMNTGRYDMIRLLALGRQQMATALFVSNIFYSRGHDIMTYPYIYNNRYGVQLYISTKKSILGGIILSTAFFSNLILPVTSSEKFL